MSVFTNFLKKIKLPNKIIFIVEDNEVYAKSLQSFIQSRFPHLNEPKIFNTGEMCLTEMYRKPMLVIVDYFLNSSFKSAYNGIEIIKRIKAQSPQTNIIVLSTLEKADDISEIIKQYDCSYVRKGPEAFGHLEILVKEIIDHKTSPQLQLLNN